MNLSKKVNAEVQLMFRRYGKYVAFLRRHPVHAVRVLFNIIIPPHEGSILGKCWSGYRNNVLKCSRGTSKTFTVGSLFSPLRVLLFPKNKALIASASRFRGGKMVMKDSDRLITGRLSGQKLDGTWVRSSIGHAKTIKHDPDMWSIEYRSGASVFTLPTNNEEAIRGMRANIMVLDERNTFDGEAIQTVYAPFLAVGTDFENPAKGSEGNQIFAVGTIDYSYRDWHKEITSVKDLGRLQYELYQAFYKADWSTYDDILATHGHRLRGMSTQFIRYDYTDLLIPTTINNHKVHYPGARPDRDIRWDERDQCEYIYTYPVNKRVLEDPLDEGIVDKESWEAEQRNVFIRASGSVYPPDLVEKVTGSIFSKTEEKKRDWDSQKEGTHYVGPILYNCADPCVVGVDTARTADFTALVVIRMGDLPEEFYKGSDYSLKRHTGFSSWSNVIWTEQHHHMTTAQTADLIREYRKRYNVVSLVDVPGVIMDARGGGVHVRDELAMPSPPVDPKTGQAIPGWKSPQKIYDLEDDEYKHLIMDTDAWGGLKLLNTTDTLNQELVSYSKAQMEVGRLFIGAYKPQNERGKDEYSMSIGYLGVRTLKHQLLRIQAVPTPSGKSVRFEMPGDPKKIENKKDLLMAFLYACFGARMLQNRFSKVITQAPVAYGRILRI